MDENTKKLYHLVKKEVDDRLKELEQEKKTSPAKTSDDEDGSLTMNDESLAASSSSAPVSAIHLLPSRSKAPLLPAAADDERKKKKRRYIYAPSTIEILEASSSPMSISLYSSMQLPFGCLAEHDGCGDDELVARAKRCHEILRLSQQVKEAEAAGVKAKAKQDCRARTKLFAHMRTADTVFC